MGLAAAVVLGCSGALLVLPAGLSLPEAAAGCFLGPRFANRNTPSKTGHRKEKWPRIPLLGSPFKATGSLSQETALEGMLEVEGMEKTHGLMGAVK